MNKKIKYWYFNSASFDADAAAFFTAAGITDATQKTAVNNLVVGLKAQGLWTKCNAIYPFVGGTATTNKYNLKNPAANLTFQGGWTHASTGSKPNGSTGYAQTGIIPTSIALNDVHLSFYSRTDDDAGTDMGAGADYLVLRAKSTSIMSQLMNQATSDFFANAAGTGFYIGTRTGDNTANGYKNGSNLITSVASSTNRATVEVYLGAFNNGGSAAQFSAKEQAFASIGTGLSVSDAANYNTLVQAFQTTLGRNV